MLAPEPKPGREGLGSHAGTWPRFSCLGRQRQAAAPLHSREFLSAALRCQPGLSGSCSGERGGSQPHCAITAPTHSQMNGRKQVGHPSPAHARSQPHTELTLPNPASPNPIRDQPDLVVSPVPSTRAWLGGQGWWLAGELCRPLFLAIILHVKSPWAQTLPQRPA